MGEALDCLAKESMFEKNENLEKKKEKKLLKEFKMN